jgi:leucyl aminopeptidase
LHLHVEKSKNVHLWVLPFFSDDWEKSVVWKSLSASNQKWVRAWLKSQDFDGESGVLHWVPLPQDEGSVVILGLGKREKLRAEGLRKAGAQVVRAVSKKSLKAIGWVWTDLPDQDTDCFVAWAEGWTLGLYSFDQYRKPKKPKVAPSEVHVWIRSQAKGSELKRAYTYAQTVCSGVAYARDWVNKSASEKVPELLAKEAKALQGITTKVWDEKQSAKMGMGAFVGVGQGSDHPPRFIEMHYKPKVKPKKSIVIVGKGVTFDSGGLSIKPAKGMETMKCDMSGAAAVMAVLSLLPKLQWPIEVWGLVAAAENMINGKAQRPGDVVSAMNGKTIEVLNTDAEGRLTLADALHFGVGKKPDFIVDIATLTGAVIIALGNLYTGVMSNNDVLSQALIQAGNQAGESMWPLPLPEEYKADFKSAIADYKNIGNGSAGTIIGGLFLQEFVGQVPWAHLDIAGTAWTEAPRSYETKGGTGVMVRTLLRWLRSLV